MSVEQVTPMCGRHSFGGSGDLGLLVTARKPGTRVLLVPVLGQHRPALVVAPPSADLEIARREALAGETGTGRQRDRCLVPGLDVRLDPVQSERLEGDADDEVESLAHVPLIGEPAADGVAEIRALEGA